MVTCELDPEISGEILGWKLPVWQALVFHRVLPSCGGLLVYLTLMCFDFALIYEHFHNGQNVIGAFCIILITLPAVISLIFTLASPPPSLETELSGFTVNIEKKDLKWILMQFVSFIFFPVAAIERYCYLIFWWIEAVFASRDEDKERTREALMMVRKRSSMELYLFLQAFLHAAPHAILNILNLMARFDNPIYGKASMQAVSIVVSCMRMSSTATLYRRFEREKINGRRYPWNKNYSLIPDINFAKNNTDSNKAVAEEPIYESIAKHPFELQHSIGDYTENRTTTNIDLIKFSPRNTKDDEMIYDDILTDSESSSSEYLPPVTQNNQSHIPTSYNSDDEYVRPISIIDKVAPRRSTQYTIERVEIIPPPAIPAPKPSLSVWAERMVENAESIPSWLSAPERRKYVDEVIKDEPDIPRRIPIKRMRGLEPQDATAALVHYLGWYAFFVSRLLSIAAFINFSIIAAVIVLFSHYQVMLLLLIIPQASTARRGFYIFLAFIYLFCLMEFKIRFRHVRVWHVFWMIVCTAETVIFTGLWAGIDNDLHHWWKSYVVKVIFLSLLLSYMCFMVYFVLLQPKETVVTIKKDNKDTTK